MKRRNFIKISSASSALFLSGFKGSVANYNENGVLSEPSKKIPIKGVYDVIVAGAGPAGVAAAVMSARNGAKTLLLETNGCLGGTWTSGLLSWILDSENKTGIMRELRKKLEELNAGKSNGYSYAFDIEKMKLILDDLVTTAGVDVLIHCRAVGVVKKSDIITHLITESKSGREAFSGKIFIDCTGDGDLAKFAECEFEVGRSQDQATQPMSMLALISGVRYSEIEPFVRRKEESGSITKQRLLDEINRAGIVPSYKLPTLFPIHDTLFSLMANHEYNISFESVKETTIATIRARKEVHQIVDGLKKLGGVWKDVNIVATANQIGVREGRRIKGLYTVSENDIYKGIRHYDAICSVTFGVDVHAMKPGEKDNNYHTGVSQPYDIPYRAIVSKDISNMLMAGRNISGDFMAHSSYRVTGNAVVLGEAAGVAAAVCANKNIQPRQIDIVELKSKLV